MPFQILTNGVLSIIEIADKPKSRVNCTIIDFATYITSQRVVEHGNTWRDGSKEENASFLEKLKDSKQTPEKDAKSPYILKDLNFLSMQRMSPLPYTNKESVAILEEADNCLELEDYKRYLPKNIINQLSVLINSLGLHNPQLPPCMLEPSIPCYSHAH